MSFLIHVRNVPERDLVALVGLATMPGGWIHKRPDLLNGRNVNITMAFPTKGGARAYVGALVKYLNLTAEQMEVQEYTFPWEATEETRALFDNTVDNTVEE